MLSPKWSLLCLFLLQCFNVVFTSSINNLSPRASKRKVRWVFDIVSSLHGELQYTDPNDERRKIVETVVASHSALWIDVDENNGPKKLEIGNDDPSRATTGLYLRDFDLTTRNANVGPNL